MRGSRAEHPSRRLMCLTPNDSFQSHLLYSSVNSVSQATTRAQLRTMIPCNLILCTLLQIPFNPIYCSVNSFLLHLLFCKFLSIPSTVLLIPFYHIYFSVNSSQSYLMFCKFCLSSNSCVSKKDSFQSYPLFCKFLSTPSTVL